MYLTLLDENMKEVKTKYKNKPFFIFLSLTNTCNANCVFCDVRCNEKLLCSVDVYKLIDELAELGTKYLHFTGGGEPFTDSKIIDYMQYATSKGMNIVFITNGFLLKSQIDKLVNMNLKAIFVSLDSCFPKVHNSLRRTENLFENAVEGINELKRKLPNVKVNLNHVVNSQNIDFFEGFIKLKESVNFDYLNPIVIKDCEELTPSKEQICDFNNKKSYYLDLLRQYGLNLLCQSLDIFDSEIKLNGARTQNQDMRCLFANFTAFIDCPTGKVYPCDCSIHCDRNLYCLGSLHEETFKNIWAGQKRADLLNMLNKGELNCKIKCDEANCIFNRNIVKEG